MEKIRETEGEKTIFGLASSGRSQEQLLFFRDLMKGAWNADQMDTIDGTHFRTISEAWKHLGSSYPETSWKAIPEADFILMVGANPMKTQPVIASLLRRGILERQMRVAVFGQIECLPPFVHYHIPMENRKAPLLARAMIPDLAAFPGRISRIDLLEKISRKSREIHPGEILEEAELDQDARKVLHDVAKAFLEAQNPLVMVGTEVAESGDAAMLGDVFSLALLKGLLPDGAARIIILKPYGNSAGAWNLGLASGARPQRETSMEWRAVSFRRGGYSGRVCIG